MNTWTVRLPMLRLLLLAAGLATAQEPPQRALDLVLVTGAPGTEEYAQRFDQQVQAWQKAGAQAGARVTHIGAGDQAVKRLEEALHTAAAAADGHLWLVLIGHGTYDGREARFNLPGPDLAPKQLAGWLQPLQRELVFVHTGAASAAFLEALAGPKRVLVSATKSADEIYYARFGEFFAPAIAGDPAADLDQDRQVSVLEAFLHAGRQVTEFYAQEERIATEHALLDDNGDGDGTRQEAFEGLLLKAGAPRAGTPEGRRAAQIALVLNAEETRLSESQRARRDALETRLADLRTQREPLGEARYYQELEALLRELAALYAAP